MLDEASAVRIEKAFVDAKPRTTIFLSETGRKRFGEYLNALSDVVEKARQALPTETTASTNAFSAQPAKA